MMTNGHPRGLKFSVADAVAVLAKVLPKFLFNRTLLGVTGSKLALLLSLVLTIGPPQWLQGGTI